MFDKGVLVEQLEDLSTDKTIYEYLQSPIDDFTLERHDILGCEKTF